MTPTHAQRIERDDGVVELLDIPAQQIVAATDELYPSTIVCDLDDAHVWPAREWVKLGRRIHEEGMMSA